MTDETQLNTRLTTRFDDYFVKDNGDVARKQEGVRYEADTGQMVSNTYEVNLTKRYRAGPRTTGDVEMLVMEAEAAADGETANWAEPVDAEAEAAARRRIEADGLTPAWEVGT